MAAVVVVAVVGKENKMKTLKVLGCLLAYPSKEQVQALPEFEAILNKEKWIPSGSLTAVGKLMSWMNNQDILDLQEEYVALFDRTPSLCLHLFEHVHGDSRDRGQALVDLSEIYKDVGLFINTEEMPDYLPLFLEYLSIISAEEACDNLGSLVNILASIAGRLQNRQSPYASVFEALIEASASKPDKKAVAEALKESSGDTFSFDEIDAVWEEQNAFENTLQTTGQDMNAGCPKAEEMLARMNLQVGEPVPEKFRNKEA